MQLPGGTYSKVSRRRAIQGGDRSTNAGARESCYQWEKAATQWGARSARQKMTLSEVQRTGELEDWGMKIHTNVPRKTCAGMNKGAGGAAEKMEHSR